MEEGASIGSNTTHYIFGLNKFIPSRINQVFRFEAYGCIATVIASSIV